MNIVKKRIKLIFHMDEVPLTELIFYGRRLSHFYLFFMISAIVLFALKFEADSMVSTIIGIIELILSVANFIALRIVVTNATKLNTLIAVILSIAMEIVFLFNFVRSLF